MRRNASGFTLIEVTFAFGVLAMALTFLLGAVINTHSVRETLTHKQAASMRADDVLETLRGLSPAELARVEPASLGGAEGNPAVSIALLEPDGTERPLPLPPGVSLRAGSAALVRVTVMWTTPRGHAVPSVRTAYVGAEP